MQPSERCIAFIKSQEGLDLIARRDVDGSWILGYSCKEFGGKPVTEGQTTDLAGADVECRAQANKLARGIDNFSRNPLTQGQLDALTDFAYNTGMLALLGSTLWRCHQAGFPVTESMFVAWNKIHKDGALVELPALTKRRQLEWAMFSSTANETKAS